jgi:outer membrane protein assembly factor BamE (lipoprotein component of BamABCDE complex)
MALSLNACTFNFWYKDFETQGDKLNPPKLHLLSIGMTKQQVISSSK